MYNNITIDYTTKVATEYNFGEAYETLLEDYERYRYFNESGVKFHNYIGCKFIF